MDSEQKKKIGIGIAVGLAAGVGIGLIVDMLLLCSVVGLVIGAGVAFIGRKTKQ